MLYNLVFGLLTVVMVLDCVVLVTLVLWQLPKKEAGAGMAFGGGAADALFGAGSGNALTTITKYAAGIFFSLALLMAIMTANHTKNGSNEFENAVTAPVAAGSHPQPATQPSLAPSTAPSTNFLMPIPATTNAAAAPVPAPAATTNK